MRSVTPGSLSECIHRLARAATALSVFSAASASATQLVVNCNDDGPGSLRGAVAAAADGETVDMTTLACSPITLTTAAIAVTQNNLTIDGPGPLALLIDGGHTFPPDRVVNHTGTGTLTISGVAIAFGKPNELAFFSDINGGCIYSKGSVVLDDASVYSCLAQASDYDARGGGVFVRGALSVKYSSISGNSVSGRHCYGGGAVAYGDFVANLATISGNSVSCAYDLPLGGGVLLKGNATILGSTISGNFSTQRAAGIANVNTTPGTATLRIVNSTISGNKALSAAGGIYTDAGTTKIYNTTIAFNNAGSEGSPRFAPGLAVHASAADVALQLDSSLFSNNTYGSSTPVEDDLSETASGGKQITVTGANNLVRVAVASLPNDTLTYFCPRLGPLRNNGGPTPTHALLSGSPAIDAGNNDAVNPLTMGPYLYDQRGAGFARVSGTAADIGAYEVQVDDIVFNAGFEGCP